MGLNANAAPYVPPAPPLPVHPALPNPPVVPVGYQLVNGWHWGFDVWAHQNNVHWAGHNAGEQPHFNIRPAAGGNTLHVYYWAGGNGVVISVNGIVQWWY